MIRGRLSRWTIALLWLLTGTGLSARAAIAVPQDPSAPVDRIVAVVADTAITQTEMLDYILQLQARGMQPPSDPSQARPFMQEMLNQKVNQVLLVIYAQREGITVDDRQVNDVVEDRIASVRRRYRSEAEFQQALANEGISAAEYRMRVTDQVRAEYLTQQYVQMKASQMPPIPVSEEEIRASFEAQKAALGPRPATVTLKQVVITPQPSEDARLRALEETERILSRLRSGEDFATLATEYSEDPVSAQNGGQLGWVRQGDLVPEFEAALFNMQVGDISDIVETTFGFHIIKLDRVRGGERSARHILIRPEMTDDDLARARRRADEVAEALRAGADPDSLIRLYSDPDEQSSLTRFPQDRLPPEYREAIQGAESGDVLDPFRMELPGIEGGKWVVVKLIDLDPGGEWTLDDVRENLRQSLQQDRMVQKVVDDLRETTYIDVREDAIDSMADLLFASGSTVR
jgi:peptidyl-prolyl cis-trans isomerase SurA